MRIRPVVWLAAGAALMLPACASLEPEPCTAQWVDWQKGQIFDSFTQEHRSAISTLRTLEGDLQQPDMLTAFRLAGLIGDMRKMGEDFGTRVVPQIEAALSQCAAPGEASALLSDMLRREGVGEDVLVWVDTLALVMERRQNRS